MILRKVKHLKAISELRQDPISGDWVLIAPGRAQRPEFFIRKREIKIKPVLRDPFDNPQKFGNAPPILVYQKSSGRDWFLQVIPNKYPAVGPGQCKVIKKDHSYVIQDGVGHHEVVILRDHKKHLAQYKKEELKMLLSAYQDRYRSIAREECFDYISIFHNHGWEAGASVSHPHSQILALPVVPPDVYRSIRGSRDYFHEHNKCIHCRMISDELKDGRRIVFESKSAVVFAPFASHSNFELRIFPKRHEAFFEKVKDRELLGIADAIKQTFLRIYKALHDPPFNFFLHTAPTIKKPDHSHYHWHFEILPKLATFGGFELGTGIDIVTITPEIAAALFRKIK